MTILGIGTDVVENQRIKNSIKKTSSNKNHLTNKSV